MTQSRLVGTVGDGKSSEGNHKHLKTAVFRTLWEPRPERRRNVVSWYLDVAQDRAVWPCGTNPISMAGLFKPVAEKRFGVGSGDSTRDEGEPMVSNLCQFVHGDFLQEIYWFCPYKLCLLVSWFRDRNLCKKWTR
ncbi:hypothetical protein Bca4012_051588 [Brassica carinata]